jgi:hypothetical protein
MFIRILRQKEQKEILFNANQISKIEVTYGFPPDPDKPHMLWETALQAAVDSEDARRVYRIFVGGDTFLIDSGDNNAVTHAIEAIYKDAIKA